MTIAAVHGTIRIADVDGMGIRLFGQNSALYLLSLLHFHEQVTQAAVFRQNGPVVAFMFPVVAAKAAQAVHVSALARVALPALLHVRVIVAIVKILHSRDNPLKHLPPRSGDVRILLLIELHDGIPDAGAGRFP